MPDRTRILLIDDHALVREGIARLLSAQPDLEVVGQVATVDAGVEIVRTHPVDVVLLDINLGTHQGGAFLSLARGAGFTGKVLIVTAGVGKIEAARLLERGYAGIFLKHEPPPLLIERIRAIVAGTAIPDPRTNEALLAQFRGPDEPFRPLTPRERDILRGVYAGHTNKEIARDHGISEPLVKAILQQLFKKAGVRSRAQLVRVAVEKYWKEIEEN